MSLPISAPVNIKSSSRGAAVAAGVSGTAGVAIWDSSLYVCMCVSLVCVCVCVCVSVCVFFVSCVYCVSEKLLFVCVTYF